MKNMHHYILQTNLVECKLSIYLNNCYKNKFLSASIYSSDKYFICNIFNNQLQSIYSLQLSSSSQEELKLTVYKRQHFLNNFVDKNIIFLLFIYFINDFKFYHNIYKLLMRIYITLSDLTVKERT